MKYKGVNLLKIGIVITLISLAIDSYLSFPVFQPTESDVVFNSLQSILMYASNVLHSAVFLLLFLFIYLNVKQDA